MASNLTAKDEEIEDILECKLCLEPLNQPKSLPCQHSFCLGCIKDLIEKNAPRRNLPCPVCRDIWEVPKEGPEALKTSFLINKLKDIAKRTTQAEPSETKSFNCQLHPDRLLELYCQADSTLICYKCYADHHAGHTFIDTNKAAEIHLGDMNKTIQQHLASLSDIINTEEEENAEIMRKNVRLIEQVNLNRKQAQDAINKEFDSKVNEIFNRQGTQIRSRISQLEKLQTTKASTESLLTHLETMTDTGQNVEVVKLCLEIKENGLPKPECDPMPPFVHLNYNKCAILQDRIIFGSLSKVTENKRLKTSTLDIKKEKPAEVPSANTEQNEESGQMSAQNSPLNFNISCSDDFIELQELSGNVWNSFPEPSSSSSTDSNKRGLSMDLECSSKKGPGSCTDAASASDQIQIIDVSNGQLWNHPMAQSMSSLNTTESNILTLSNMSGSSMPQSFLNESSDTGSNLPRQSMSGPSMSQVFMPGSNPPRQIMSGPILPQPYMPGSNPPRQIMSGTTLPQPYMPGSNPPRQIMSGPILPQPYMPGSNPTRQIMSGPSLSQPFMPGSNLPRQIMSGSSLSQPFMPGSNPPSQIMSGPVLTQPYMPGSNPPSQIMSGPSLSQPFMPGSNLLGQIVSGPDMSQSLMHGSSSTQSNLPRQMVSESSMSQPFIPGSNSAESNLPRQTLSDSSVPQPFMPGPNP